MRITCGASRTCRNGTGGFMKTHSRYSGSRSLRNENTTDARRRHCVSVMKFAQKTCCRRNAVNGEGEEEGNEGFERVEIRSKAHLGNHNFLVRAQPSKKSTLRNRFYASSCKKIERRRLIETVLYNILRYTRRNFNVAELSILKSTKEGDYISRNYIVIIYHVRLH